MIRVLLVGGSDSSGGAGIARDVATVSGMGAHGCIAVTAVTAQDDAGLLAVHPVPPDMVARQIRAAGDVGAVKLGMLRGADTIRAVAAALPSAPLVIDPVLRTSSGGALLDGAGLNALLTDLLPRAAVLMPNLPELDAIGACLGTACLGTRGRDATIAALLGRGCGALLVKGGHADDPGTCTDRLFLPGAAEQRFSGPRLPGTLRGTGCQLASAVAAGLAAGEALPAAIRRARALVADRFAARQP